MSLKKRLFSDTAVYGTSSILARGLNYLLTFLIASLIPTGEFGIFTDLYAMTGFMLVLLTHGMETSYFRHVNLYGNSKNIFGAAFSSVGGASAIFLLLILLFLQPVADLLRYPDKSAYIAVFAFIIFFDVISAIPFARLRQLRKARRFAAIRIANILITISLNVIFLMAVPEWMERTGRTIAWYNPADKVYYVFLANLIASAATFLMLMPGLERLSFRIEKAVYMRMLRYALPVMIMGFAGVINEMFDRKILRFLLPYDDAENLRQLGIYGFAYKLSMVMALFLQAYRYAVEPILFSEAGNKDAPSAYAGIMRYFTLSAGLLFVLILFNLPLLEYLLFEVGNYNPDYRASFAVVPTLLAANGFLGIYFNISTWYKVTDRTMFGAAIALTGAAITIGLNLWWVPVYGYVGSAWATLICYVFMTALGLYFGQRYYPIPYDYRRLTRYLLTTAACAAIWVLLRHAGWYWFTAASLLLCAGFYFVFLRRKRAS